MVLVWDTQTPQRKAWEMSESGYEQLNKKSPNRYKIKEQPKIVVVEKKSPVVVESRIIRVNPPTQKEKGKTPKPPKIEG